VQLFGNGAVSQQAGRHGNLQAQPVLGHADIKDISTLWLAAASRRRTVLRRLVALCMPCKLRDVSNTDGHQGGG
jgi:hypothetical protein